MGILLRHLWLMAIMVWISCAAIQANRYVLFMDNICLEYTDKFELIRRVDVAKCSQFNKPYLDELSDTITTNEGNTRDLENYLKQLSCEQQFMTRVIRLRDTPVDELIASPTAGGAAISRDSVDAYDKESPLFHLRSAYEEKRNRHIEGPSSENELRMTLVDIEEQYLSDIGDEIEEKEDSLEILQNAHRTLTEQQAQLSNGYQYSAFIAHHFQMIAANASLDEAEMIFMGYATMENDKPALIQEVIRKNASQGDLVLVHTVDLGAMVDWSKRTEQDPLKKGFLKFFTGEMKDKLAVKGWDHKSVIQVQRTADRWATLQMKPDLSPSDLRSEQSSINQLALLKMQDLASLDPRHASLIRSIDYFKNPQSDFNKRFPKTNYLNSKIFYISTNGPISDNRLVQALHQSNKKYVIMTLPHAPINPETYNKAIGFYGKPGLFQ